MAKRYDTKEIRDTIGALDFDGVKVSEIHKRLNEKTAGLPYKVPISKRQVYNYRAAYRAEHGIPTEQISGNELRDSISSVKKRIIELMAREAAFYQNKPPGRLTKQQVGIARAIFDALGHMERKEMVAANRLRLSDIAATQRPGKEDQGPESAIEKLAREEREAKAEQEEGERSAPNAPDAAGGEAEGKERGATVPTQPEDLQGTGGEGRKAEELGGFEDGGEGATMPEQHMAGVA